MRLGYWYDLCAPLPLENVAMLSIAVLLPYASHVDEGDIVALGPVIRTFQTTYDPGVGWVCGDGVEFQGHAARVLSVLRTYTMPCRRVVSCLRRAIASTTAFGTVKHVRLRIRDLVDELHKRAWPSGCTSCTR